MVAVPSGKFPFDVFLPIMKRFQATGTPESFYWSVNDAYHTVESELYDQVHASVTKYVNELYADVFARTYGFNTIGLRYFNVFGPRQDPNGAYAAVIPKWIASMLKGEPVYINGDGETSRDFCFIENVLQINLLAAASEDSGATNQVYNVAVGDRTTLNQLYEQLHLNLLPSYPHLQGVKPVYRDFRAGDVRHSLADIRKATTLLGHQPTHRIGEGLKMAMQWYVQHLSQQGKA